MIFNSKTGRVALEPGDMVRCKNANDAATLADIFCDRGINWEIVYKKGEQKGIWLVVLEEDAEQ